MKFVRQLIAATLALAVLLMGCGLAEAELKLPASLKTIGSKAFYGDTKLEKVTLPEGVTKIGSLAFANSSLTQINLPDSLTSIDDTAFDGPEKVRVTANEGSYAYRWAVSNGYIADPSTFPESTHPYENLLDKEWSYTYPVSAAYLKVTFSEDTETENKYDTLTITDSAGSTTYSGTQLAGRSVSIVGNHFTLRLQSDSSVSKYGFRITSIVPSASAPVSAVTVSPAMTFLRKGNTLALTATVEPDNVSNKKVIWSSSNTAVAKVSSAGVVTGVAEGTANITATSAADTAIQGVCVVKVGSGFPESDHPYDNNLDLEYTYTHPTTANYLKVTFSDDTEFEDKYDTLTITDSAGSTTYTGTALTGKTLYLAGRNFTLQLHTDNSQTRYGFRITDIQAVDSIPVLGVTISPATGVMRPGNTLTLTATVEPAAVPNKKVNWSSSNTAVATVTSAGVVTALANGTATITATSAADKTKKATCAITVTNNVSFALLVGQMHFNGNASDLLFTEQDVAIINSVLQVRHASNGSSWNVVRRYDRTASQVHADIQGALGSATASDVSLFYLSTHGITNLGPSEAYASAVLCTDGSLIKTSELASWLGEIKGKVIVMIDACGSGGFIYDNSAKAVSNADQFNKAIVDAFIDADPGVYVPVVNKETGKVGELRRENKFYVLTASAFQQASWGGSDGSYFTKLVRDGVGTSGTMPADTSHAGNSNNQLTLHELYKYISDIGDNHQFSSGDTQQVQVFPENSSFVLFKP